MSSGLPNLHRAGRVGLADMGEGRGSTGSPTARLVRWALDVGLDPLVLSYQEERTGNPRPEAQVLRLTAGGH